MTSNREVISRLKLIGCVQKGEKINVKMLYVQPDSFMTSISRTLIHPDNKTNTISFVTETINRAFELIETHSRTDKVYNNVLRSSIIKDIKGAKQGMVHLKETYVHDIKFCCDMDCIIENIDAKLAEMRVFEEPNMIELKDN